VAVQQDDQRERTLAARPDKKTFGLAAGAGKEEACGIARRKRVQFGQRDSRTRRASGQEKKTQGSKKNFPVHRDFLSLKRPKPKRLHGQPRFSINES
jgi:hypothetical protein